MSLVNERLVATAHGATCRSTWTVNDADEMHRLLDMASTAS